MNKMKTQIKHFAMVLVSNPGILNKFTLEFEEQEIAERDPKLVKLDKRAVGYYFFDRETIICMLNNGKKFTAEVRCNESPKTLIGTIAPVSKSSDYYDDPRLVGVLKQAAPGQLNIPIWKANNDTVVDQSQIRYVEDERVVDK